MIQKEIEAILAWQDVSDGDIDVDGVMKQFSQENINLINLMNMAFGVYCCRRRS